MILPSELDVTQTNIEKTIELRIIEYNKSKIRKATEVYRNNKRIELNNEKYKLSKAEKEQIVSDIINSEDTKKLKKQLYNEIRKEKEDYLQLRTDLYGLNKLNETNLKEYITLEKTDLYSFSKLPLYRDLLIDSIKLSDLHNQLIVDKQQLIDEDLNQTKIEIVNRKEKNLEVLQYDALSLIIKIREMYNITNDMDDIDIFDKFEYNSNIDYSEELSYIIKQIIKLNPKQQFLNILLNTKDSNIVLSDKFLSVLFSNKFISSNEVTCFENMYSNNLNNRDVFMTRTLGELLLEIINPDNVNISKEKRQQIYMTYDGTRPSKEEYYKWNGLQVFDLDLKDWIKQGGSIEELKKLLHINLCNFNWYLWICKSSSGNGLHIYTKVAPPFHSFTEPSKNEYISKYVHQVNYISKRQVINEILYLIHSNQSNSVRFDIDNYGYDNLTNKYLDNVVSRITAGIRLSFDMQPLINNKFIDLPLGFDLTKSINGINEFNIDKIFITKHDKTIINIIDNINNNLAITDYDKWLDGNNTNREKFDLSKYKELVNINTDLDEIKPIDRSKINYVTRYNVCNTLAAIFGNEGLPLAHILLDSKKCKNEYEINSFYSCAISNGKEPTKLGLELLKKNGIIKSIDNSLTEQVNNTFKDELKTQINQVIDIDTESGFFDYHLSNNEYLSDIQDKLESRITGEKVNVIISPAGSGKTNMILNLAKQGKRIMLVLPYISIISNKIENDEKIRKYFDVYYGNRDIRDIQPNRNVVTTFDKLSRANYEKISRMFDYIMIDEEHLLYISSYRIDTTSNVIKKIKDLYYISNNDPLAAKIILLTGTQIGHEQFFSKVQNTIRVYKKSNYKSMEFLMCDDSLDALITLSYRVTELLKDKYTILIPTNKGELYSEKLIGMIQYLLGREVKYGYYKRSNIEQEICRLINEQTTVGDYEIIFCSNYLSVGVDINDTDKKFASIYLGNFSGYEIEQFNARIRKEKIKSIYCIITQDNQGNIKQELLNEPDLILRITNEEVENFLDDKNIAKAKNEFIAEYDPILRKITTAGFSLINGKIDFNLEEYELITFENKYNDCMQHPVKVAKELAKYGYDITVTENVSIVDKSQQELIKKIGIDSMFAEKQKKHNLMIGTFLDLVNQNNYENENGLEFHNLIEWIGKNNDKIIENRNLFDTKNNKEIFVKPIYDVFATPVKIEVKSKEALEKMLKYAKYLVTKYSPKKSSSILLQYVDDNGILKQKYFKRAINLMKLIDSSDANELSEPITKILNKMYRFVDQFEVDKNFRIGYDTYKTQMNMWINEYVEDLGIKLNTKYAFEKVRDCINELLNDLCTKQTSKNGLRFSYNKLPEQDSVVILNRKSIDSLVTNMFKLSEVNTIADTNIVRKKHIIFDKQKF